jgi:hypothetical protein
MVKKSDPKPSNPNTVTIYGKPGDDSDAAIAEAYLRPTVQAGATVRALPRVFHFDQRLQSRPAL